MKDYLLSDFVKQCRKTQIANDEPQDCERCMEINAELSSFCINNFSRCPLKWDIEEKRAEFLDNNKWNGEKALLAIAKIFEVGGGK